MSTTSSKRERQKARRAERLAEEQAEERRAGMRNRLVTVIGAVVALAVVVGVGILLVQGSDASLGVPAATADDGSVLPDIPQAGADPAIGTEAPVVVGYEPDGTALAIGGEGAPQAVVFMAHWCPHCQEELPLIGDWVADGQLADGVQLVAVSTLHDPARPNWPPDEWLASEDFPGEVLVDSDGAAAEAWGLSGTPMWVFTDADGTVVARYSGQIDAERFAEATALAAGPAA
ncbi:hypothetical protein DVS28_a1505 [Euzebya pacifica]|uniref:Thioredoxin domain-containing protein n=1 Tax=Euzebya pacifica TaxID=1608957 RepID=A0A346XVF1_9ACTN|nr:TlpA disulfide reductase family protein [Euzebya pacifica]AXV06198.1 hypothetical protein DVS28_a1505 [Euzebya pacifica]